MLSDGVEIPAHRKCLVSLSSALSSQQLGDPTPYPFWPSALRGHQGGWTVPTLKMKTFLGRRGWCLRQGHTSWWQQSQDRQTYVLTPAEYLLPIRHQCLF